MTKWALMLACIFVTMPKTALAIEKPVGAFVCSCRSHFRQQLPIFGKTRVIEIKSCTEIYDDPSSRAACLDICKVHKSDYAKVKIEFVGPFNGASWQRCSSKGLIAKCSDGFTADYYYILKNSGEVGKGPNCKSR
jgi:hypothetical protein